LEGIEKLCDYYEVNRQFTRSITALAELPGLQKKDNPTGLSPVPGMLLPDTWKPGRNMVFLAIAFSYAYTLGCSVVAMGAHQEDYPGYPDCRDTFLESMEHTAQLALASPIALWVPLLYFDKPGIVSLGTRLKVPYELTWSCYSPVGDKACGKCDACIRRWKAFQSNKQLDPIPYDVIPSEEAK
jgi:7-cyano-7-deazaguanine synthase